MFSAERHEPSPAFPRVPDTLKARYAIGELALRPFGLYESDLSVDFNHTLRPFLVTQILEGCTRSDGRPERVNQSFFWDLTVGQRIECLLNLVSSSAGPEISVAFLCPNVECGRELEVEITAAELAELQAEAYAAERVSVEFENTQLALRRPTGSDQLTWLRGRYAQEDAAVRQMLRTLLLEAAEPPAVADDTMPRELVQLVGLALEEHDPLVNFSLRIRCSDCEIESPFEIDLEGLALRRLRQAQLRLLETVHRLATYYHWSEQEIFAVPHWRRVQYLNLIENEKN
jgi:hypothetical protein